MALPFFYISDYTGEQQVTLNEETSRHVVQVLRMKEGECLNLTDGKGHLLTCEIFEISKKTCIVKVLTTSNQQQDYDYTIWLRKKTGNTGTSLSLYQPPGDKDNDNSGECVCNSLSYLVCHKKSYSQCFSCRFTALGSIARQFLVYPSGTGLSESYHISASV